MASALTSGSSGLGSLPTRDARLCSWARHYTLTAQCLSALVYKWVTANLMLGVALQCTNIHSRKE